MCSTTWSLQITSIFWFTEEPPRRYRIIDFGSLIRLLGFTDLQKLQSVHKRWIEASWQIDEPGREGHWTESIASGSKSFVEEVKQRLGFKAKAKCIRGTKDLYQLREDIAKFGNTSSHGSEPITTPDAGATNTIVWRNVS